MNKKFIFIIVIILVAISGIMGFFLLNNIGNDENNNKVVANNVHTNNNKKKNEEKESKMNLILSLEDEITDDSVWCGTFNLIWNDLRDELAKQDIEFEEQTDVIDNLNKGTFSTEDLDEASYYKIYGNPSFELKDEIEQAIKEKFNEESDILDDFTWFENPSELDYFLYVMLKKEFQFPKTFTKLDDGVFGNYENIKYFGIDDSTNKNVRDQVEVLYYKSKDDFAVKLFTKQNDQVIISKGNEKESFGEIYDDIIEQNENYDGDFKFTEKDILKIPNIKIDIKENIKEVENKPFLFSNNTEYIIDQAIQTIKFELDEKGGKIKSEAGMSVKAMAMEPDKELETREFEVDDTFVMFLKEEDSELPYFATKISDINNVQ